MYKLAAYIGPAIHLDQFLLKPTGSLLTQATEPGGLQCSEYFADGFGIGWYAADGTPAIYANPLPIWSDTNLPYLARSLFGQLWLAEVRHAVTPFMASGVTIQPFFDQRLIFLHSLILMLGAHYTYARVPPGFWFQEWFDLSRNHYDRLGHLAQGFVPAILAREVLLRRSPLQPGKWLFFLVTCVCLAISACYEFLEWGTALAGGESADAFLGTQGDIWDTQWDMFLALLGAMTAQATLARLHDRQLRTMGLLPDADLG